MRRRPFFVVAALILAFPATASATIVPQRGMAGVRLGMTQERVRSILGEPLRVLVGFVID
jgi:hypothetical protein